MKYSVIYLGHGGSKYIKQTVFSVYTLLHLLLKENTTDVQIFVYTDNVAAMPKHDLVTSIALSKRELADLKGPFAYVHRAKLAVLTQAAQELEGPFIYVDCDTKWIRHPRDAFRNLATASKGGKPLLLMHELETPIDTVSNADYYRRLKEGYSFQKRLSIKEPWVMWNSGTIGCYRPGDFFAECVAITDEILATTKRKNWAEQLAVSLLANTRFDIQPFGAYLTHYWRESVQLPITIDAIMKETVHCSSVFEIAEVCATYPIDGQLKNFKHTLKTRIQKRLFKTRFSFLKRKMQFFVLLRNRSFKNRLSTS